MADKSLKKARFENIHSIQIGKNYYDEKDLEKYFNADDDTLVLLKRVFQKDYPITRTSNGLPRVPSNTEDKHRLITSLETYFNNLRQRILEKKFKSGDTVSLRENIEQIQHIKLLIEHFEESDETFPYHMFENYLENKDYIKSTKDVNKQMRQFQFTKSQNERVRNLLRQFAKLYLEDMKKHEYDIKDPGMFPNRFEEFMRGRDIKKIPPILRDLLLLLDGKHSVIAMEDEKVRDKEYDPSKVYSELTRLLDEIDPPAQPTSGGAKPYLDKTQGVKGLDEQITSVVDHILEKYRELRGSHDTIISEKDAKYGTLESATQAEISVLKEKLATAESSVTALLTENATLVAQIANLEGEITSKDSQIEEKNSQLGRLIKELSVANSNLSRALRNKEYSESEVSRFQRLLDNQIKTLTIQIKELQQDIANLESEKDRIEDEKNTLVPQLAEANRLKTEALAEVERLRRLLAEKDADLSGNKTELTQLRTNKTTLETDLSGARATIGEKDGEIQILKGRIGEKDVDIKAKDTTITNLERQKAELEQQKAQLERDKDAKQEEYDRLNREKERIERELEGLIRSNEQGSAQSARNLQESLDTLRRDLDTSKQVELDGLRNRIAELQARIRELEEAESRYNAEVDRLRRELASLRASGLGIADLERRISELTAQLATQKSTYQAELGEITRAKDALEREIVLLRTTNPRLERDISNALAKVTEFITIRDTALAEQERLTRELEAKTEELRLSNLALDQTKAQAVEYKRLYEQHQRQNKTLEERIQALEANQQNIEVKDAEIRTLRTTIASLEERLTSQRDSIVAETQRQIRENDQRKTSEITNLTEQLRQAQADLKACLGEKSSLIKTNSSLRGTIEKNQRTIDALQRLLDDCLNKNKKPQQFIDSVIESSDSIPIMDEFLNQKFGALTLFDYIKAYSNDTTNKQFTSQFNLLNELVNFFTNERLSQIKNETGLLEDFKKLNNLIKQFGIPTNNLNSYRTKFGDRNPTPSDLRTVLKLKKYIDPIIETILSRSDLPEKSAVLNDFRNKKRNRQQYGGGDNEDDLFDYCSKVADNSLKEFLLETPLPFFTLIKDFEEKSKLDIIQSINEEYILKLFIQRHLEKYFESKTMKEFYYHSKDLLAKENCYEYAKMFFVLQEVINMIKSDERNIDVLRIKTKEYNSLFDFLLYKLEQHEFDFYNAVKKEFLETSQYDFTFNKSIFIKISDKNKKHYDLNKDLSITLADYDYDESIFYMNSSMVYIFFILSTHFYLQSENMIDLDDYKEIEDSLEKTVRKMKRKTSKEKRSIQELMEERKKIIN